MLYLCLTFQSFAQEQQVVVLRERPLAEFSLQLNRFLGDLAITLTLTTLLRPPPPTVILLRVLSPDSCEDSTAL